MFLKQSSTGNISDEELLKEFLDNDDENINNPVSSEGSSLLPAKGKRTSPYFNSPKSKNRERNDKYRFTKLLEDERKFRMKKSESQKRYVSRLKAQDLEGFRKKKAAAQKRYLMKVKRLKALQNAN